MANVLLFLRRSTPDGLGQVAWAMELPHGNYLMGADENPLRLTECPPDRMGHWAREVPDPTRVARSGPLGTYAPYEAYKLLDVLHPRVPEAIQAMERVSRQPFHHETRNGIHAARAILAAYGAELPEVPAGNQAAQWWDAVQAPPHAVLAAVAPVDATLYGGASWSGPRYDVFEHGALENLHELGWSDHVNSLVVRSGYVALYEEPALRGRYAKYGPGTMLAGLDHWGGRIGSVYASPVDFDPHAVREPAQAALAATL